MSSLFYFENKPVFFRSDVISEFSIEGVLIGCFLIIQSALLSATPLGRIDLTAPFY